MEKNKNRTSYFIASIVTSNYFLGKLYFYTHKWQKKIFLISVHSTPLSDCLHIMNGDFILCIHMFDAEVYRSSSCICSQSLDGKMEVKKNAQDTHTQKRDELLSSKEPHVLHMVLLWWKMHLSCSPCKQYIWRPLVQWQEGTVVQHPDNWGKTEFPHVQVWLSSR